jgi:predicted permease
MREDFTAAVRALRHSPAFTTVALVVLALGIGTATAVFSVVDAVVLRGLPFDEYDRLAAVFEKDTKRATTFGEGSVTPQTYLDWRRLQQPFSAMAAVSSTTFRLKSEGGEPADARGQRVTWEFFPVLRVSPIRGRSFTAEDEEEGRRPALISFGFWQRRFGGSPDVVGKTIDLNEETWEIVGVLPRTFLYPVGSNKPAEVFVPQVFASKDRVRSTNHNYNYGIIGRLKDGVSLKLAHEQMERLSVQLDEQYPAWEPGWRARVVPLREHLVGKVRGWMLMLLGAVALVLLIACANVANLMVARATVKAREIGVRAALGAGPWRLVRASLMEGVVLSLAGAAIGIALAYGGVIVLRAWLPPELPRIASIGVDFRVLGAAIAAALGTGLLFGALPALHAARPDLTRALKDGGRSATAGIGGQRLRHLLVVAEIALAMMLLVGAGLFGGSFVRLMRVDPGFDYRRVIAFDISLRMGPHEKFDEAFAAKSKAYVERALEAARRVPGVESAALVSGGLPLTGSWSRTGIEVPGKGERLHQDGIDQRVVTPGYLELLRVPLLKGRYLSADDREHAPAVMVINAAAAREYWPGQEALGQHAKVNGVDRTVVGIVGDIHHLGPEVPPRQECYLPMAQRRAYGGTLVARSSADPMRVLPGVKAAIWSVNPEQRLNGDSLTLEGYMDRLIAQRRFNMAVLALFGVIALVIAAVGIYGVMAYVVAQRTGEIGIRMALGATRGRVVGMVLSRAALLIAAGLAIGGVGAWSLRASVKAFLFEVQPGDVRIFVAALVTLASAALLASAIPARRAAAVDPLVALRQE